MSRLVIPLLTTAGVLGLLYASRSEAAPPQPGPIPQPQPQSVDPGASGPFLERFRVLLAQIATNPQGVEPRQIGLLATQLRAVGRDAEAAQLEGLGPAVCQFKGLPSNCWTMAITGTQASRSRESVASPPVPPTATAAAQAPLFTPVMTSTLRAKAAALKASVFDRLARLESPSAINAYEMDQIALSLLAAGLTAEANEMNKSAAAIHVAQNTSVNPYPPNPNASSLPTALNVQVIEYLRPDYLANAIADSAKVNLLTATLRGLYPTGFSTELSKLDAVARQLSAMGR